MALNSGFSLLVDRGFQDWSAVPFQNGVIKITQTKEKKEIQVQGKIYSAFYCKKCDLLLAPEQAYDDHLVLIHQKLKTCPVCKVAKDRKEFSTDPDSHLRTKKIEKLICRDCIESRRQEALDGERRETSS